MSTEEQWIEQPWTEKPWSQEPWSEEPWSEKPWTENPGQWEWNPPSTTEKPNLPFVEKTSQEEQKPCEPGSYDAVPGKIEAETKR